MNLDLIEWSAIFRNLIYIGAAYLLALPVAWNRERESRGAGLRTFPLVAIASCAFVLIAQRAFPESADAQARIVQGLITGIGFIGGGAILKHNEDVRGVATATSIWATGAIGVAAAFSRYEIAIIISLVTFLTLRFMSPIKEKIKDEKDKGDSDDNSLKS
ncbi:MAG: MgtC/SapB family protein [Acidobacteriota bacterium]|nr:MgtC/SapB family protein [Acidobacteriota bacterium]